MNSSQLAGLAAVSVRTLRHYHQVGVLREPPRESNGYRRYDVHDLIRVLRIKHLAALGMALAEMPTLLDETGDDVDPLLDRLDSELGAEIARLEAQRRLIDELRGHGGAPDLPPELAPFFALSSSMLSPAMAKMDREQSVLLAHLVGDAGMPDLIAIYERVSSPELLAASAGFTADFEALEPDADDERIDSLIHRFMQVFEPLIRELAGHGWSTDLTGAEALLTEYVEGVLNPAQTRALGLIAARVGSAH